MRSEFRYKALIYLTCGYKEGISVAAKVAKSDEARRVGGLRGLKTEVWT